MGRHWFLSNRVEGTVSLIDTQDMKVAASIKVAGGPDCMDITPDGKELWVTQRFLRRIAVVDLEQMRVVASVPVGKSPHGLFMLKSGALPPGTGPVSRGVDGERPKVAGRADARPHRHLGGPFRPGFFETLVSPLLFRFGLMEWYEPAFNAVEIFMLGIVQILVIALGMRFFEKALAARKDGQRQSGRRRPASTPC